MASNTQYLENIYSFLELFFEDVDIVFEIDPQAGKIFIISNNQHEDSTKKTLRDGVQKLLKKRPQSELMNPVRLPVPINGTKKTIFIIPWKKKEDETPRYLGVIVGGIENEKLEGFLSRNIRKKLESDSAAASGKSGMINRKLLEFQQYSKKLEEAVQKRKQENVKLFKELQSIKQDKEYTEENYKRLLALIDELEAERDESQRMTEQVIEENGKLIGQLDEFREIIARVTEFENEKEGYTRLLQEKDKTIQKWKQGVENKKNFLNKFKHLILEIGEAGHISYCNKNVEKFYADSFGKTGVVKQHYHKVMKSDDLPKIETAVNEAISSGKETSVDVRLHKANPKTYKTEKHYFKLVVFPLKGGPETDDSAGLLLLPT